MKGFRGFSSAYEEPAFQPRCDCLPVVNTLTGSRKRKYHQACWRAVFCIPPPLFHTLRHPIAESIFLVHQAVGFFM